MVIAEADLAPEAGVLAVTVAGLALQSLSLDHLERKRQFTQRKKNYAKEDVNNDK